MAKAASSAERFSPKYIVSLALAAAAILVVGFLLKPRQTASEGQAPPSRAETQRLARMARRQALDTMTDHFSEVARGLGQTVVQVGAGTGSGIVWEDGVVVTSGRGAPSPESTVVMTPAGHLLTATRVAGGPQLPLAAYALPGETQLRTSPVSGAESLRQAQWVLSVWHKEGDLAFSAGHFVGARLRSCGETVVDEVITSVSFSEEMAGGALFDLDGGLVGVVLPCGAGYAAMSPDTVSRVVALGRSLNGQLLARYGMATLPGSEAERAHLGVEAGALVTEVWTGQLADLVGIRPGDVIVALGEHPVSSPMDLEPLLLPPDLGMRTVTVHRGDEPVEIGLSLDGASAEEEADGGHGVSLDAGAAGYPVGVVTSGSRADEAGLRSGDRIVRVDGVEPRNAAALQKSLGRLPALVEVVRGPRRLGILVEP